MECVLAIDIGGTKTSATLVTAGATMGQRVTVATPASDGPDAVLNTAAQAARSALSSAQRVQPGLSAAAVGVGAAGMLDTSSTVVGATGTFTGWVGTNVAAELARRLALPVAACNDVDAHALGEDWRGASAATGYSLMVAIGTGVGAAVIRHGMVQTGAHGGAGEVGHVPSRLALDERCPCGRTGHLEAVAAGPAIAARYSRRKKLPEAADTRTVIQRAASGDADAAAVVDEAAGALGEAMAGMITLLDPEMVVVGGGLVHVGTRWWNVLVDTISAHLTPPVANTAVVPAALGPDAALVGAARYAWMNIGHDSDVLQSMSAGDTAPPHRHMELSQQKEKGR
ncbi:ROK family protein [Phytoactinopolyspora endophytica]|uniref:ROK family protein n=1 Tax=Phytoactinopolyspora endophytica TaxID=1642495 RepID=UPI00101CE38A|nr:ROK family protein [Phytoactinopolyspora endophytica]